MVEKKFLHEKEREKKKTFTISVSRFILLEKKRNNFIRSRCDTVSVIEDGKHSLEPLWLQRGIDGC